MSREPNQDTDANLAACLQPARRPGTEDGSCRLIRGFPGSWRPAEVVPHDRGHAIRPWLSGVGKRISARGAEDYFLQAVGMRDKVAGCELRPGGVAVECETLIKGRNVLPGDLIHQCIHELVGINPSAGQGPVSAEL